MEALLVLFALGVAGAVLVAPVLALVALSRTGRLARELEELRQVVARLERRPVGRASSPAHAEPASAPAVLPTVPPAEPAPAPVIATSVPVPVPALAPPAAPPPAAPPPAPSVSTAPRPRREPVPARPAAPGVDFATSLGPKLLVGAGGLAVVVFLGFFVRYAWENEWVGPTGRVLSGAVFSLGLVAAGLRLLPREYRPLGQGLAATGLAGLYVTGFAAHAVYGLVPRPAAGLFMFVVTACAVALAERLDARLLAGLAWAGAYLAPVLLSTGEDRALSLFAYLLLLGAGAVWLDRRKPWPETLPLALVGTVLLYAGWYGQFFRPERFGVAAGGLVTLTALFALGAASKQRPASLGFVALIAAGGLSLLGADANRPEVVLPLCLLLAGALLRAAQPALGLVASAVVAIPFLAWTAAHYRPEAFGVAAAWVGAGALLLVVLAPAGTSFAAPVSAVALVGGGLASIGLAVATDRPLALLALLAAQAGLAVLAARRWSWAEPIAALLGSLAVLAWFGRYYAPEKAGEALALALTLAGAYFLIETVRGAVRERLGLAGAVTHLVAAALAWGALYRAWSVASPTLLGPAAVVLGALHLLLGLAARRRGEDALRTHVALGLAASFLTLAIPAQLGLHGITAGWALEGVLLLWLGVRHGSALTRAFGYGVLALAIVRLFARHLPLHPGSFVPAWNPVFGTWLLVILALLGAHVLARRLEPDQAVAGLDGAARLALTPLALLLLFGLLTAETQSAFGQSAQAALVAQDADGATSARRQGDLAVSVLWTTFAMGLLAGGLGLRSRGLFYAGYGLFALTAAKVVLVDLSTLPTVYRMLSFLVLGVLLLAGAWLNLRFRERLTPPGEAA